MKFTQVAAWEVTNEHLAATARGEDEPDTAPDVVQAVRDWLTSHGATAAEADIHAALDHVEHQRRRQRALPLIGIARKLEMPPATRQAAHRTTIGGTDARLAGRAARRQGAPMRPAAAIWAAAAVSAEERDRRRLADEQLRAEIAAVVEAQPPDTAAALRDVVRPDVDDHLRRCPGLSDRTALEPPAIVVTVLQQLRGRSIAETIAALIADVHRRPVPPPVEAAPDVTARFADLRRRLAG
jgi:hypothetical protein